MNITKNENGEPGKNKSWCEDDFFWQKFQAGMFDSNTWLRAETEAAQVAALLGVKSGLRILDLCCGPGRHLVPLALGGMQMTGVDRTAAYLEIAQAKAKAAGVEVRLVLSDMREYINPSAFDAVIVMYNSFGYFEDHHDDERVLANIYRSLDERGRLVMDISSKETVARNFRPEWIFKEGEVEIEVREKILQDWTWREMHWQLKNHEAHHYVTGHRLYSAAEMKSALIKAGFTKVKIFSEFNQHVYDERANRMVVLASK